MAGSGAAAMAVAEAMVAEMARGDMTAGGREAETGTGSDDSDGAEEAEETAVGRGGGSLSGSIRGGSMAFCADGAATGTV